MATGFKGTIIKVGSITISSKAPMGAVVSFRVLFADEEGVAHGHINHEVSAEDPAMFEAAKALLAACSAYAEKAHYTSTNTPISSTAIHRGISETLSEQPDDPSEPGEQG